MRYYLEKRDPEFEPKMAEILCIYRQVAVLREPGQGAASATEGTQESQAIISYDEKPAIQAIGTTAPDRPPLPGRPTGRGSISSRASSQSWCVRSCATSASAPNTNSTNA